MTKCMLPPEQVPPLLVEAIKPLYKAVQRLHRYRVEGLERIPRDGPALIVFNHSLATYDIFLFGATVYLTTGRLISSLGDRAIFKTPGLAQAAHVLGAVQGEPRTARSLLDAGRLVGVAPGGMKEALRPSTRRYELDWQRRMGFVRLALDAKVPVYLAACPKADDIFTVVDNPVTRWVYERFRLPAPLALGPWPAQLTTYVSERIEPEGDVRDFHARLVKRMEQLMRQGSQT